MRIRIRNTALITCRLSCAFPADRLSFLLLPFISLLLWLGLALSDKIAFAARFLSDQQLTDYLEREWVNLLAAGSSQVCVQPIRAEITCYNDQ